MPFLLQLWVGEMGTQFVFCLRTVSSNIPEQEATAITALSRFANLILRATVLRHFLSLNIALKYM